MELRILALALGFATLLGAVPADPAVYEPGRDPGLGVVLISWWSFGASGATVSEDAIDDVYAHGTHVTICPLRFVDLASGDLRLSDGTTTGLDLAHIEAGVARATALGLEVTLNPFVEPDGFSSWRGRMNFIGAAKATFWQDATAPPWLLTRAAAA